MAALEREGGKEEVMGVLKGARTNERTQSDCVSLGSILRIYFLEMRRHYPRNESGNKNKKLHRRGKI